jgi:uncharacterized membrane protein YeaQ/YmgE (transglycosylase-associated protein family)
MIEQDNIEINWTAAFAGFFVDWTFSELGGWIVVLVMFSLKGLALDSVEELPPDVHLASQIVGVGGAVVGGTVAGYLARRQGSLHGVLGSLIGLFTSLCLFSMYGDLGLDAGYLGFIVLNLIGAGYGGGVGERWRVQREGAD